MPLPPEVRFITIAVSPTESVTRIIKFPPLDNPFAFTLTEIDGIMSISNDMASTNSGKFLFTDTVYGPDFITDGLHFYNTILGQKQGKTPILVSFL